jgi:hypothetical protein
VIRSIISIGACFASLSTALRYTTTYCSCRDVN